MMPSGRQLSMKLMQQCPACSGSILPRDSKIVREGDGFLLIHVHCPSCSMNFMAHVVLNTIGLIGNAIITDLTYDEALKTVGDDGLTDDEFLTIYREIQSRHLLETFTHNLNNN